MKRRKRLFVELRTILHPKFFKERGTPMRWISGLSVSLFTLNWLGNPHFKLLKSKPPTKKSRPANTASLIMSPSQKRQKNLSKEFWSLTPPKDPLSMKSFKTPSWPPSPSPKPFPEAPWLALLPRTSLKFTRELKPAPRPQRTTIRGIWCRTRTQKRTWTWWATSPTASQTKRTKW